MRLFSLLLCLIFGLQTFAFADDVVLEQLKQMQAKFDLMQTRMDQLEQKVVLQNEEIVGYQAAKQKHEIQINELKEQIALSQQNDLIFNRRDSAAKWTPEIGVIVDTVATLDSAKVDEEGADRVSVRELELVLGSDVDPYSRLDATISFSDFEDPSLEEAYLTRFGLPFDTTARLGKFKPKVGKALTMHRDGLDTVDEPLVIARYFGVEGMNKSGVDFSKTLNSSLPITQQISFGLLEGGNGEEGTAFGEIRRRPTAYSHLKNYLDVTDATGFELGFSHMIGSRDEDSRLEVQVLAADATLTHNFNANQSLKLQAEVFNLSRKESFLDVQEDDGLGGTVINRYDIDGNLWGSYGLVDFYFHPQWSAGFRYDNVQLVDNLDNPDQSDVGYTGYLTFYQSEFARWRAQFTHKDLATGKDDNAVYLQGTFAIGDHKHKIQ